jgi:hypothetical protein
LALTNRRLATESEFRNASPLLNFARISGFFSWNGEPLNVGSSTEVDLLIHAPRKQSAEGKRDYYDFPTARKSSRPSATSLTKVLDKGLFAYATAASAAGVGALALAQPAEAKIVYTPASVQFTRNLTVNLDLNQDGITDFRIRLNFSNFGNRASWDLLASANAAGNGIVGKSYAASALPVGSAIGPRKQFTGSAGSLAVGMARLYTFYRTIRTNSGAWTNATARYLGLKFSIHGQTHYGWARLSVRTHGTNGQILAMLTGYAYETVANTPLAAGKTTGPASGSTGDHSSFAPQDDFIPPQPTLGLLAQGSATLPIWRKREEA